MCLTSRAACGHRSLTNDPLLLRQVIGARLVYCYTMLCSGWRSLTLLSC
jgi:hypothetical protein